MTVEPCDRSRNATEDDLMRNKLVYIINIKTMISSCPQSIEPFGKCIGNRLFGILIHPCGNPDRNNRNYNACDSYRQIEVNRVRLSIRTDKMSERNESCKAGNNRQKYQRKSHSQRTLMRATRCRFQVSVRCAMIRMGACPGRLGPPEDAVVEAEHIEGGHCGDYCHHPTHCRAILEAGSQNLIF